MTSSKRAPGSRASSHANTAYRAALSTSVQEICAAWERVCEEPDADGLTVLHRLAHNLNGACALLGYAELGAAARRLEQRLALFLAKSFPLRREEIAEIRQMTDALRQVDPLGQIARGNREEA